MTLGGFWLAWIVIAGAVAGLALIVVGGVRAFLAVRRLSKRLATYSDLPILAALERTQVRVAQISGRLGEIDALVARARAALEQIRTQLTRLRSVFAPLSSGLRIRGN